MLQWKSVFEGPSFVAYFRSLNLMRPKDETLSKHSILGPNGLYGRRWEPPKTNIRVWWYLPNYLVLTKKLGLHKFSYRRCNIQAILTWLQLNFQGPLLFGFWECVVTYCWSQLHWLMLKENKMVSRGIEGLFYKSILVLK